MFGATRHKNGKIKGVSVLPFFINTVLLSVVAYIMFSAIAVGLERQELVTCHKLDSYSQTYAPSFYVTEGQKATCDDLGVVIDAPIR